MSLFLFLLSVWCCNVPINRQGTILKSHRTVGIVDENQFYMTIWVFPKNRGGYPQKWMVKTMENPIKLDDLGGKVTIFGNTQMYQLSNPHPSNLLPFPASEGEVAPGT